jgi:hypothetical protein
VSSALTGGIKESKTAEKAKSVSLRLGVIGASIRLKIKV